MRLALFGHPVGHSRSPAIHNAALQAVGVSGGYVARDVDTAGLAVGFAELSAGSLDGANVTMPHKRRAAAWADSPDVTVRRLGAANTLAHTAMGVTAYNTDVAGVRSVVAARGLGAGPALVLGAGGAAAAALVALEGRPLGVAARDPARAAGLVAELGVAATVVGWDELWQPAVVVNATPLGMHGESLPDLRLDDAIGLLDLAYGREPTAAVTAAAAAALPCGDGLDMLVAQAAASFTVWTGKAPPLAAMERAARQS